MTNYRVRWYDVSRGSVDEAVLSADGEAQLREALARADWVPLFVEPVPDAPSKRPSFDVGWWCRELRSLLGAGMTVVEALETLQAQSANVARTSIHATLVDALRQGSPLSLALRLAGVFPSVLVAGVQAAERSGALVEALDEYLRFHELLAGLRRQATSAALYPAVVLVLGVSISLFLLAFVMPRFASLYADNPGAVSQATGWLLRISRGLALHGPGVAVAAVAALVAAVQLWRAGWWQRRWSRAMERSRWLRPVVEPFRLATLYQALALMFRGGYPLDESLSRCGSLRLGERFDRALLEARAALQAGRRVSAALGAAGLTDEVTHRLLAVAERTGRFDTVLQAIAERHASAFALQIERATRLLEPLLLLLVAVLVGGLVLAMYMPIFDLAGSL